ncbi:anthocyanidin reductase ((2S)-flavan-3-ol-forming) [Vigna radiata var. radiata]|uniref:Anthocyanidin reductase ((2S)-flavan-3-ol-forming) n=1 Tax=Vigna radiata var. radiata TaxID=3916 RepID=A0A1S3UNJ6_VIGRR|nr:anthocyanidin reductase ((2S)-flavan-3-ol-forming) [Vigna radiata var. radiata]
MASVKKIERKVCVIGGTGFIASCLIKQLLQKGYAVNTTVRDSDNTKKINHLLALQSLGELNIFGADLTSEKDFDAPIAGCELVFQLATPVNFASEDPENDMIKPAISGVLNVLKACARAEGVKRVILTSSTAAVTINPVKETGLVMDESNWTDVEFLSTAKPPTWGYPVSKALAEKAAWKFAEENHMDLITVIPTLTNGPSLTPDIPSSVGLATSLITGNDFLINTLKGMQFISGSISITHVEDICRAHIFVAEKESASGRYIVSAHNTSVPELAKFLSTRYPQYKVPTEFDDCPSKAKLIISSEKLVKEGFNFKYGIEEIYDQTLEYLKSKGALKN